MVTIGLAVGLGGAVLVALPSLNDGHNSVTGVLLILAALVCYGFSINLARPLQQRNGALPVIWRALGVALILTAPLGVPDVAAARWSLGPVLALLALGTLGTGIANALVATAAGRAGATRASATTFIIPVVALILGVVVRHEQVSIVSVIGCAVCLVGAWLISRAPAPAARAR